MVIVKFIGNDEEINIKTKYPEFLDWKWEELSKITDTVVEFKLHVYKEIQTCSDFAQIAQCEWEKTARQLHLMAKTPH